MHMPAFFTAILALALGLSLNAFAAEPETSKPVAKAPELFRIGDVKVWAIADNTNDRDMSVFLAEPEVVNQYAPTGKSPSGVLCFLLETPTGIVILDSGNGNPPEKAPASLLMDSLKQLNVAPEAVAAVILTHMHADHIGGMAWEGKAAFPNAVVKIGRIEHDFWTSEKSLEQFPDRKRNFDHVKDILALYDGKLEIFDFGVEVIPGLTALDSRGHTPGHTAFLLESNGEKLLCIGDLLHSAALQFARPDINARYDMAPDMAKSARREFLAKAAWNNLPIAGMHLPFPGIGSVATDGPEGFVYTPGLK